VAPLAASRGDGLRVERVALSVTAHRRVTGAGVLSTFRAAYGRYGIPASTLTDNAMVFTTRLSGGQGGRNDFESELRALGVIQKNPKPNHPTTCGKVERFQQTLKAWLAGQPPPHSILELQHLLDTFVAIYNQQRPHRSLPNNAPPGVIYRTRPKASPGDRSHDHHWRVRRDRVDTTGSVTLRHNGRLHHIGLGRTHARTPILLLIADLDIRVVHATTGEILRHLTLDPTRNHQPLHPAAPHPRKPQQPDPQ
jgi:hypothetical protein